jgi:hypothetical protein
VVGLNRFRASKANCLSSPNVLEIKCHSSIMYVMPYLLPQRLPRRRHTGREEFRGKCSKRNHTGAHPKVQKKIAQPFIQHTSTAPYLCSTVYSSCIQSYLGCSPTQTSLCNTVAALQMAVALSQGALAACREGKCDAQILLKVWQL